MGRPQLSSPSSGDLGEGAHPQLSSLFSDIHVPWSTEAAPSLGPGSLTVSRLFQERGLRVLCNCDSVGAGRGHQMGPAAHRGALSFLPWVLGAPRLGQLSRLQRLPSPPASHSLITSEFLGYLENHPLSMKALSLVGRLSRLFAFG